MLQKDVTKRYFQSQGRRFTTQRGTAKRPLRVISRSRQVRGARPLCPQEQTRMDQQSAAAVCQQRTFPYNEGQGRSGVPSAAQLTGPAARNRLLSASQEPSLLASK